VSAPFKPAREHERETVIAFDSLSDGGVVWTSDPVVYRVLVTSGYIPGVDPDDATVGARFEIADKRDIRLPVHRPVSSEAKGSGVRREANNG
jgi:hypothetical protein